MTLNGMAITLYKDSVLNIDSEKELLKNEAESFISRVSVQPKKYVANLNTVAELDNINGFSFPMTINNYEYENSYICSPYTALIPYALQEAKYIDGIFAKNITKLFLPFYGVYLKLSKINKVIFVNNWLLSTNLYPVHWHGEGVKDAVNKIKEQHPLNAIAFRSLNYFSNKDLIEELVENGFVLVPSRQVYIYDTDVNAAMKHRQNKVDFKLLENTSYKILTNVQVEEKHLPRIVELYNKLYIEKYSIHNPQFTTSFIKFALESHFFDIEIFVDVDGQIDAVGGRFIIGNIVTIPIVGYDTALPQKLGLYRMVLASTQKFALENGMIFNVSSGAAHFKRLRGAKPFIEYTAIYISHLSFFRKLAWMITGKILNSVIVPIMKKYKL